MTAGLAGLGTGDVMMFEKTFGVGSGEPHGQAMAGDMGRILHFAGRIAFIAGTAVRMMLQGIGSAAGALSLSSGGMPVRRSVVASLLVGGVALLGGGGWFVFAMSDGLSPAQLKRVVREARRELGAGRPESALAALQPALRPETVDPGVWEAAGRTFLVLRHGSEAVNAFGRISPESELFAPSRLGLARALLIEGNWDRALSVLEEATARDPTDLAALEELRWLQFNLLQSDEALETLSRKLIAGDLGALPDLLETAHRRPVPQESLPVLVGIDGRCPGQPTVKLALGRCRWHLGELQAARGLLLEALSLRPNDPLTRLTVAEFLLEEGETDEAERVLSALHGGGFSLDGTVSSGIAQSSSGVQAGRTNQEQDWSIRSQILERRGDVQGALAALENGEARGTSRVEWLTRRASLLRVLRRIEEARETARLAEEAAAAERELGTLVDTGKHRNPGLADARQIAAACRVLKRGAESEGWQLIAARLSGSSSLRSGGP